MSNRRLVIYSTLLAVGAGGLAGIPSAYAFDMGDMMSPNKWFGGKKDRYYDDYYDYYGPYGGGYGPYGWGGPYGGGWGGPYGYGYPGYGYGYPGYQQQQQSSEPPPAPLPQ